MIQRIYLVAINADTTALDKGASFGFGFGQVRRNQCVDQAISRLVQQNAGHAILGKLFKVSFGQRAQLTREQALADALSGFQGFSPVYEAGSLLG